MTKLAVYDPPMCCSTGVCGPAVDPVLPRVAADLDWLKRQGVQVERYNLAQQPQAFASNPDGDRRPPRARQRLPAARPRRWPGRLPRDLSRAARNSLGSRASRPLPRRAHAQEAASSCCSSPAWWPSVAHCPLEVRVSAANWRMSRWSFPVPSLEICSSPARAGSARPRSPAPRPSASPTSGKRVLLVSTDPASNLDEVFGVELGMAAHAGSRRAGPLRDEHRPGGRGPRLPRADGRARTAACSPTPSVRSMEEQFSGACTIGDRRVRRVLDGSWAMPRPPPSSTTSSSTRLRPGTRCGSCNCPRPGRCSSRTTSAGNSCLGPLSGLTAQRALYEAALKALADAETTTLVLVSRPEATALREADRTSRELAELGIKNQRLVLNGLFAASDPSDPIAVALEARGRAALAGAAGRPGSSAPHRGAAPALRAHRRRRRCGR